MRQIILIILFICTLCSAGYSQGSVLLVGGGTENYGDWSDQPYRWFVEHAPNRKILVLHYTDTTTWFTGYFPSLSPCTVSNRFINSINMANDSAVYRFILQHDGIFLRGGDQAQYVSKWNNTLTQKAIKEVYQRGGVVGGTSAGEMVLSSVSYLSGNSDTGSLLRAPGSSITLSDDFLPFISNALAESHTNERGRIGRLPVFLARYKDSTQREITGIAVDVNTALAVNSNGTGEVMGGSAVAILRWAPNTSYQIETGRSFAMQNLKFDQLLPGYKINLITGEITVPSTAVPFNPKQFSSPEGIVILDGSGNASDWSAAEGSLKKLQSSLAAPNDIVGIISSPGAVADANSANIFLTSLGISTRLLWLNDAKKNDPGFSANASGCNAFVIVSNSLDSLAGFLDPQTGIGNIFSAKVAGKSPLLFLSDNVMLAGEKAIGGIYTSAYNAYYGSLTQLQGLNLLKGIQLIPRFYQNQNNSRNYDYTENRIMGMFWSMSKSQLPYGMIIDAGAHVVFTKNNIEVFGISLASTPVILFDARAASWTDLPVFHRPGKPNAVQNSAFIGAVLQIIRPGDTRGLVRIEEAEFILPNNFNLEQNYPNPFNPSTMIGFKIANSGLVTLKIYDILGREISTLANRKFEKGNYQIRWDSTGNSSGVYFAKLDHITDGLVNSKTIKMLLAK